MFSQLAEGGFPRYYVSPLQHKILETIPFGIYNQIIITDQID